MAVYACHRDHSFRGPRAMTRFPVAALILLSTGVSALSQQPAPSSPAAAPGALGDGVSAAPPTLKPPPERPAGAAVPRRQPRASTATTPADKPVADEQTRRKEDDARAAASKAQSEKVRKADEARIEARDKRLRRSLRAICSGC